MNLFTYHCSVQESVTLQWVREKVRRALGENFVPLVNGAVQQVDRQLDDAGFRILTPTTEVVFEIFLNKPARRVLVVRFYPLGYGEPLSAEGTDFEILELSAGRVSEDTLKKLQKEITGNTITHGTVLETKRLDGVNKSLGKLSPNGKKLAESKLRRDIQRLYDDGLRLKLARIMSTYGDNLLTSEAIRKLLGESKRSIGTLCNDSALFGNTYAISCRRCGTPHLILSHKKRAGEVLADSDNYCTSCKGRGTLGLMEGYRLTEAVRVGIQHGIWLESLASDIVSKRTRHIWSGQMVNSNELDVLAIYCDKIILIECKDRSFGQNDFYVTAMKAQEIGAHVVFIIVTHDINPSVQSMINTYKMETDRAFKTIVGNSTKAISGSLDEALDEIRENYIGDWLWPQRSMDYTWGMT